MNLRISFLIIALAGCATTDVVPLSRNQVLISTSAAPACGVSGARDVASKMAAVETIRRGFDRYVILGAKAENNVRVTQTPPRHSYSTGTFNTFGGTTYGSVTTTYAGSMPVIGGSNNADLLVVMFKTGEPGYQDAIDAKAVLGPEWQQIVVDGINTC